MDSMDTDWQSGKCLTESCQMMLEREIAADVTFVFTGSPVKIKAHKCMLMCRSHVFYVMFSSSLTLSKPDQDIEIKDTEPAVFKELLKFLYCDDGQISAQNAFHLLYAAQKYQVEILKSKCVDFLEKNLNAETVGPILDQGVFYNEEKLTRKCLDFLSENPTTNLKNINLHHVAKETLELIVDCESIVVNEIHIFGICNLWANLECAKRGIVGNGQNKREVLGSVLSKIRFCSMTNEEIASAVSDSGLLTMQEELEVFRFINSPNKKTAPFPSKKRMVVTITLPPNFNKVSHRNKNYYIAFMSMKANSTTDIFQIRLTCPKTFQLLGFTFRETGTFQIRINENDDETVRVSECSRAVFLRRPAMGEANRALVIQGKGIKEPAVQALPEPNWQPHRVDLTPDQPVEECSVATKNGPYSQCDFNVAFNIKKVGNIVVPFAGFILTD